MKKKIPAIIACAALAMLLTGCSTPKESKIQNENNSSGTSDKDISPSTSSSKPGEYDDSIASSAELFLL